jgi:hypothetical protein
VLNIRATLMSDTGYVTELGGHDGFAKEQSIAMSMVSELASSILPKFEDNQQSVHHAHCSSLYQFLPI